MMADSQGHKFGPADLQDPNLFWLNSELDFLRSTVAQLDRAVAPLTTQSAQTGAVLRVQGGSLGRGRISYQ
jgi:hypothetical protein